jgi:hypothetical protein
MLHPIRRLVPMVGIAFDSWSMALMECAGGFLIIPADLYLTYAATMPLTERYPT